MFLLLASVSWAEETIRMNGAFWIIRCHRLCHLGVPCAQDSFLMLQPTQMVRWNGAMSNSVFYGTGSEAKAARTACCPFSFHELDISSQCSKNNKENKGTQQLSQQRMGEVPTLICIFFCLHLPPTTLREKNRAMCTAANNGQRQTHTRGLLELRSSHLLHPQNAAKFQKLTALVNDGCRQNTAKLDIQMRSREESGRGSQAALFIVTSTCIPRR